MTTTGPLDHYRGNQLAQTKRLTNLHDEDLRKRAITAARDKHFEDLWQLTLAHLTTYGHSGILTSPSTIKNYRTHIKHFVQHATDHAWDLLRPRRNDPQLWVQTLLAAKKKPATVGAKVAGARALYAALRWAGATESDPFRDIRIPKDPTPSIEKNPPYSMAEFLDVLDECDEHDRLLVLLVGHAGLRIAEAMSLEWNDLDVQKRRLTVRSGKGRKQRTVPMSRELRKAFMAYKVIFQGRKRHAERLFAFSTYNAAKYHIHKCFLKAGLDWRGFHAFRKLAGTRLHRQIKDIGRVRPFLGHSSVDTTMAYVEIPADDLQGEVEDW